MKFLYPNLSRYQIPQMILLAIAGAAIAGMYGILHDQITYSLAPEYFTKLKFQQFHCLPSAGIPVRVQVARVGFQATFWVGFFAGWFFSRISVPGLPLREAWYRTLQAFLILTGTAVFGGLIGFILGTRRMGDPDFSNWIDFQVMNEVTDLPRFVRVAYIHNSGYLGALTGLIIGIFWLRAAVKRFNRFKNQSHPSETFAA